MPTPPPRVFRLLIVEDDIGRVQELRAWLPAWARLVWAQSAGTALGLIRRDRGAVYAGVLLDHDLDLRTITADDETLSGSQVAIALMECFSPDVPILIHSMNQIQAPRLVRQLEAKGFWVTRLPFSEMTASRFLSWLEEARELWEEAQPQNASPPR